MLGGLVCIFGCFSPINLCLRSDDPIPQPMILVTMGEETSEARCVIAAAMIAGKYSGPHLSEVREPGF
jgi:hypothetical protein